MTQCQRQGQLQKLKLGFVQKLARTASTIWRQGPEWPPIFLQSISLAAKGLNLKTDAMAWRGWMGGKCKMIPRYWCFIDISRFSLIRWFSLQSLKHENCKMPQVTEVCFTSTIFHLSSFRLSRWLTRVLNDPHSRGLWCLELRRIPRSRWGPYPSRPSTAPGSLCTSRSWRRGKGRWYCNRSTFSPWTLCLLPLYKYKSSST